MRKSHCFRICPDIVVDTTTILGKGATGTVYQGKCLSNGDTIAVKIVELKNIQNQVTRYLLEMEKLALMNVKSDHLLRGIKVVENQKYCMIATEYCNGTTLSEKIKSQGYLSELESLLIFCDLLKGYKVMCEEQILHRDLKPANIMFHNKTVKIIDFGYCQIKGCTKPSQSYNVGTPSYMSPQVFESSNYSEKSQIWALGVILYECLNGSTLDHGRNMSCVYKQIENTGVHWRRPAHPFLQSIVEKCLIIDVDKRIGLSQLESKVQMGIQQLSNQGNKQEQRRRGVRQARTERRIRNTDGMDYQTPQTSYGILTNMYQQNMGRSNRIKTLRNNLIMSNEAPSAPQPDVTCQNHQNETQTSQLSTQKPPQTPKRSQTGSNPRTPQIKRMSPSSPSLTPSLTPYISSQTDRPRGEGVLGYGGYRWGGRGNRRAEKIKTSVFQSDQRYHRDLQLVMKKIRGFECQRVPTRYNQLIGSIAYDVKNRRKLRTQVIHA